MIRKRNWCGTMRISDPIKYSLSINGNRVPIVWKRLNHLNSGGN